MFDWYHEYESLLATLQVVFVMLGMGTTLVLEDFVAVARQPRSLIVGCLCQFLLAPALTLIAVSLCRLEAGIAAGLILIAAMPGGPLANLFTFMARGNLALSIALTGIGTVSSLVTVPVMLHSFADGYLPNDLVMPVDVILSDVALFLLAPLALGMIFRKLAPEWAPTVSTWLVRAGLVILLIIVIGSLGSGRIEPLGYGWGTPLAIIVLCLCLQNLSMLLFLLLRWSVADQTAVGVSVTIRNINLALLLATRLFPATTSTATHSFGGGVLYVILFWGALSLIVCVPTIFVQRRLLTMEALRLESQ
jgi:BASS family bile acid:Na+ symporter